MLARPELTQAQKDLLRAAEIIEERGHCKAMLEDELGRVCLVGAIHCAGLEGPEGSWERVWTALSVITRGIVGEDIDSSRLIDPSRVRLVRWNNAPERTQQQVIDRLREVAFLP